MTMSRRLFMLAGLSSAIPLPARASAPDQGPWRDFLMSYVSFDKSGASFVDYAGVSKAHHDALTNYLHALQRTDIDALDRSSQAAFWINLYNAQTVKVILDHYPVASIRDISISPGLFARGPWGRKLMQVAGKPLSLDDIEHGTLRPGWKDPRFHYALNCASRGCPNLQPRVFEAGTLETMLDAAAHAFVNHPRGVRLAGDRLVVSSIYHWFSEDFSGRKGILPHLMRYADEKTRTILRGRDDYDDHDYDWSLNEWGRT